MIKVKKANVILTVEDDEKKKYMSLGYSVIDEHGKVIEQAVPTDLGELKKAYVESKKVIASLEQEITKLKSELAKAKKSKATKE